MHSTHANNPKAIQYAKRKLMKNANLCLKNQESNANYSFDLDFVSIFEN